MHIYDSFIHSIGFDCTASTCDSKNSVSCTLFTFQDRTSLLQGSNFFLNNTKLSQIAASPKAKYQFVYGGNFEMNFVEAYATGVCIVCVDVNFLKVLTLDKNEYGIYSIKDVSFDLCELKITGETTIERSTLLSVIIDVEYYAKIVQTKIVGGSLTSHRNIELSDCHISEVCTLSPLPPLISQLTITLHHQ